MSFTNHHPIINLIYFAVIIGINMFCLNPVVLGVSLLCALFYTNLKNVKFTLPFIIFMAIINPLFNHKGVTILFYLKSGNPVTLESIVYGILSALMFLTIILWFSYLNKILNSDKILHLFCKISPNLALIISMSLRLVPKYKRQMKEIADTQKGMGLLEKNKIKQGLKILSWAVTIALEDSIDTADSMKSRGYGLRNRTRFSNYKITIQDKIMLVKMLVLIIVMILCGEGFYTKIYPTIKIASLNLKSVTAYIAFLVFCLMPRIQEIKYEYFQNRKLKFYISK